MPMIAGRFGETGPPVVTLQVMGTGGLTATIVGILDTDFIGLLPSNAEQYRLVPLLQVYVLAASLPWYNRNRENCTMREESVWQHYRWKSVWRHWKSRWPACRRIASREQRQRSPGGQRYGEPSRTIPIMRQPCA